MSNSEMARLGARHPAFLSHARCAPYGVGRSPAYKSPIGDFAADWEIRCTRPNNVLFTEGERRFTGRIHRAKIGLELALRS